MHPTGSRLEREIAALRAARGDSRPESEVSIDGAVDALAYAIEADIDRARSRAAIAGRLLAMVGVILLFGVPGLLLSVAGSHRDEWFLTVLACTLLVAMLPCSIWIYLRK